MDALGASVGMQFFSSNILASSYVVYDPHAMASDISRAIAKLEYEQVTKLLTVEEALQMVTDRSLLIMVDHAKTALTLSKEFYQNFNRLLSLTITVDDDFPENVLITYIESGASSASELVWLVKTDEDSLGVLMAVPEIEENLVNEKFKQVS